MKFVLYNSVAQTYIGSLKCPLCIDDLHIQLDKAYQFETEGEAKNHLHEIISFNHNFYIIIAVEIAEVLNT